MTTASERLARVLASARIDIDDAVRLPSESNDTWRVGSLVVRVCWRGDRARLRREALLGAQLPVALGYPEVVAAGADGDLTWMITRWVAGDSLETVWPRLGTGERRAAMHRLAELLATLHEWTPPALAGYHADLTEPSSVVGASLHPLPLARAFALAEHARRLPFVPAGLLDVVVARLHLLAEHEPAPEVLVHGDAHLANVLWRDGRVVALVDFEWARPGPRDLELEPFLRSADWSGQDPESIPLAELARIFGWLAAGYPGLFAAPDLVERLWLYQLVFNLRALFTWPLTGSPPPDHPVRLLPVFAASPDYLKRLLP